MESTALIDLEPVQPIQPPSKYIGGKRNLARLICSIIERIPHSSYNEPCVGMGGIFFRRARRPKSEAINDISGDFSLSNATRVWTQFWTSMTAEGWRLGMQAFPSSRPVRVTYPHGKGPCLGDLISNPRFFELAMGWPIDWTASAASVTAFQAWLHRSRGQFSKLLTTFEAEPEG